MSPQTYQNLIDALADFTQEEYREKGYWIADLAGIIKSGMTEDELKEFVEALKIKNEPV